MRLESLLTKIKYCSLYKNLLIILQIEKTGKLADSKLEKGELMEYVEEIKKLDNYN